MIRTGIDIVEIDRIQKAVSRHDGFLARFFTEEERAAFAEKRHPWERIAGHFAAKEAFSKFLGSGVRGFELKDIAVGYDTLGKPYLTFHGRRVRADLSISHTAATAVAVVCGEEEGSLPPQYAAYAALLPERRVDANKGDFGRILIVSGSRGMTGAACLCAAGALRAGGGLITVGVPEGERAIVACKLTEAMTLPLPERDGCLSAEGLEELTERVNRSDVCVFGPGLGGGADIETLAEGILLSETPLLIDADGINAVSRNINILKKKNCEIVLTPHPGEMSRLTGKSIAQIQADRTGAATEFAAEYGVTVVLKGAGTVIAFPDGSYRVNPTGNPGMATGGTGDVLAGVIGALIGQGCSIADAAVLGVFLHGLAGDLAREEKGEFGLIASDVAEQLPRAIQRLQLYRA